MKTKPTDGELIERFGTGCPDAFNTLIGRHYTKIFYLVFGILQDVYDAEDVTQKTLLKIYLNLHTFENRSKFSTWVYTIARNEALMLRRNKKSIPVIISMPDDSAYNHPRTQDESMKCQNDDQLEHALKILPFMDREVVKCKLLQGFSNSETGEILGLSKVAVKMRSTRLLRKLRKHLKQGNT